MRSYWKEKAEQLYDERIQLLERAEAAERMLDRYQSICGWLGIAIFVLIGGIIQWAS